MPSSSSWILLVGLLPSFPSFWFPLDLVGTRLPIARTYEQTVVKQRLHLQDAFCVSAGSDSGEGRPEADEDFSRPLP